MPFLDVLTEMNITGILEGEEIEREASSFFFLNSHSKHLFKLKPEDVFYSLFAVMQKEWWVLSYCKHKHHELKWHGQKGAAGRKRNPWQGVCLVL